jgi:hypothetical protein
MIEITRTDGLITRSQAAELCGVNPDTISLWVQRGHLCVVRREGRNVYYNLLDVAKADHMLRAGARRTKPPLATWGAGEAVDVTLLVLAATGTTSEVRRKPVVYYIRFGGRIKIGTTVSLPSRLSSIPCDEVLAIEPGGGDIETRRHTQFAEYHITGEWFRPGLELMRHIGLLRREAKINTPA